MHTINESSTTTQSRNQEDLFNTLKSLITNHRSLEDIQPLLTQIENIDAMYCKHSQRSQGRSLELHRDDDVIPVTLLSIAAICGNIDVAELLLQMGANKDLRDTSKFNACDWAIVENNIEMVRFLHTKQCLYTKKLLIPIMLTSSVNDDSRDYFNIYSDLSRCGKTNVEMIKLLVSLTDNFNDYDQKYDSYKNSLLMIATRFDDRELLEMIWAKGIQNINYKNQGFYDDMYGQEEDKDTALLISMRFKKFQAVAFCIDHNANLHHQNTNKESAMSIAINLNAVEQVDQLIAADKSFITPNKERIQCAENPLIIAIREQQIAIIAFLLNQSEITLLNKITVNNLWNPFKTDKELYFTTSLIEAIKTKNLDIISRLLDAGASIELDVPNETNTTTAMEVANTIGDLNVIQLLEEHAFRSSSYLLK